MTKSEILTIVYTEIENPLRETSTILYMGYDGKKARQIYNENSTSNVLLATINENTIIELGQATTTINAEFIKGLHL